MKFTEEDVCLCMRVSEPSGAGQTYIPLERAQSDQHIRVCVCVCA